MFIFVSNRYNKLNLQTFSTTIIQQVYSQQMHFSVFSAKTGLSRLSGCPLAISHSCLVCSIDYFHRLDPDVTHRVLSCGPVQVRDLSESDSDFKRSVPSWPVGPCRKVASCSFLPTATDINWASDSCLSVTTPDGPGPRWLRVTGGSKWPAGESSCHGQCALQRPGNDLVTGSPSQWQQR